MDDQILPLLSLKDRVILPGALLRLSTGNVRSLELVKECLLNQNSTRQFVVSLASSNESLPVHESACLVAVEALSRSIVGVQNSTPFSLLVRGVSRCRVLGLEQTEPFYKCQCSVLSESSDVEKNELVVALAGSLRTAARKFLDLLKEQSAEQNTHRNSFGGLISRRTYQMLEESSGRTLADAVASSMLLPPSSEVVLKQQRVLEQTDVAERLRFVTKLIQDQAGELKAVRAVATRMEEDLATQQRQFYLRRQLAAIQAELKHSKKQKSGARGGDKVGEGQGEEEEDGDDDLGRLRAKLEGAMHSQPAQVVGTARREMQRLEQMPESSPEHGPLRTYLEVLADLPWNKLTAGQSSAYSAASSPDAPKGATPVNSAGDELGPGGDERALEALADDDEQHLTQPAVPTTDPLRSFLPGVEFTREVLDEDHFGLEAVKKRVVEFVAVGKLKKTLKGPILCLVGPPGVGKTSLARSVARALKRHYCRVALGGVHDEAEIRGHRRTYVGAMPGTLLSALRRAQCRDPVLLLDEVDKLGASVRHGDPSAALLEVLDPEQNHSFVDHYVNLPFDLSAVTFIATANSLDGIPAPLLDRMEVIELSGYTVPEKVAIARRFLLPRQIEANGLAPNHLTVSDLALNQIVQGYTREAGVRQLEQAVASLCRGVAVKVVESQHHQQQHQHQQGNDGSETQDLSASASAAVSSAAFQGVALTGDDSCLEEMLGAPRFEHEVAARVAGVGVGTGLAWTPTGGELLFIEWLLTTPGSGKLKLTGQLGDVMQESASLALSWLRANAHHLLLPPRTLPSTHHHDDVDSSPLLDAVAALSESSDLHLHVPSGATPKDGPSAGVAIAASLVSLLSGCPLDPTTAMTGEITLRGLVLPVGGVRDKVLAAHRGGIRTVILPQRNRRDLADIPEETKAQIQFVFVDDLHQVLRELFPTLAQRPRAETTTTAVRMLAAPSPSRNTPSSVAPFRPVSSSSSSSSCALREAPCGFSPAAKGDEDLAFTPFPPLQSAL